MPEITISGPEGRLEGRYCPAEDELAPLAIVLHSHPEFGGKMDNPVEYSLYHTFAKRGFAVLRFNFRGVGRSQGKFDFGAGELNDAAVAMDWFQSIQANSRTCWIAGYQFGAWIGMQLLMRRPEVDGFIAVAPPVNIHDFSFLSPCPTSGLIVHGGKDKVIPSSEVKMLAERLQMQQGIDIKHETLRGANHFFENKVENLSKLCGKYIEQRTNREVNDNY